MTKILFICHGNICRSPMAEFIFRDMVAARGLSDRFSIASCATSAEEIGNPVHPGTVRILSAHNISCKGKRAIQLTKSDRDRYDLFIGMDYRNIQNMCRILGSAADDKIHRLLDFTDRPRDISDPWYTGNFNQTYDDVVSGCTALLSQLLSGEV